MNRFRSFLIVAVFSMVSALDVAQAAEYFTKDKNNKKRLTPTDDTAVVYVFRPATLGAAIKTWSFYEDQLIGVSKARAYAAALVPEGKHVVWGKAENTAALELDMKAGETYYIKQEIKFGFNKARVKLVSIDEAEAEKYFEKCGYVEPTDAGRARAVEIAANRLERAENKVQETQTKKKKKRKKGR